MANINKLINNKIWYVLMPLFLIAVSLLVELKIRNERYISHISNYTVNVGKNINESNYSVSLTNLNGLSELPVVIKTIQGKLPIDNIEILSALELLRKASKGDMAYVMNSLGSVVASTTDTIDGSSFTGKNFSFRPYFTRVMDNSQPFYYGAVGVVSNKRGFYLSVPVFADSINVAGVIVLKTGIQHYENLLSNLPESYAIVSDDGIIFASNHKDWLFKSTTNLSDEAIDYIIKSRRFNNIKPEPLGFTLGEPKIKIGGQKYRIESVSVFNGMWKLIVLHKPPKFNYYVFFIVIVSFIVLFSGFYFAFYLANKLGKMREWTINRERETARVIKQQDSIIQLNKTKAFLKEWKEFKTLITETATEVLNIEYSAIWLFDCTGNILECNDVYLSNEKKHIEGDQLHISEWGAYFELLKREEPIIIYAQGSNQKVYSILQEALDAANIKSAIYIPILQRTNVIGVLSFEHTGTKRVWNTDEIWFCERITNSVSLYLVMQKRKEALDALQSSNESLKIALNDARRSRELEEANARLKRSEQTLKQAYTDIKMQQNKLAHLNNQLSESNIQANKLNSELQAANILLSGQKAELIETLNKLKETQSQLVQYEKMASVGILTAGIAHEINNPLNFIHGGKTTMELFLYDNYPELTDDFKPMFEMIETGVDRAMNIIKSLNHFNRNSENNNEECNLHSIIDNCLVITHNQMKHKVQIEKDYCEQSFKLVGNEGKLHQVFINILTNAEQAIDKSGTINISTGLINGYVNIKIADTGNGISKDNIYKIAEPFFTTKAPGKGTGLGVSIALSIVQEHNGTIEYSSEEGKGTLVDILLPVAK